MKIFIASVVLLFLCVSVFAQPKVTLLKRLNDRSGDMAKEVLVFFEASPGNAEKRQAMEPFVIGFFGWKAKVVTQLGVGQIEAAHLNVCRLMLQMYDDELDTTLNTIIARAKTPVDWPLITDAEQKKIHNFVVMKNGNKYTKMLVPLDGNINNRPDPVIAWKFDTGGALGELAGNLTNWYKMPTSTSYHANISTLLKNLSRITDNVPADVPAELVINIRSLAARGGKKQYNEAERDEIAAALAKVLNTSLRFAEKKSGLPIVMTPQLSSALFDLDNGREHAKRGDHAKALAEYNRSISKVSNYGMSYYYRAKALEELGRIKESIADYDKMISLKTDLGRAYYNRGTLHIDLKLYQIVVNDMTTSLLFDPRNANAFYNRALANDELGNNDLAIADYSEAIMLSPESGDAYVRRAQIYCNKGLSAKARTDQQTAIGLGEKLSVGCR